MARDRREFDVDDGTTAEQKRGGRGAISVPPGLSMFKPKKAGSHTLDVIPFLTTEARDRFTGKMQHSKKVGVWYPERTYLVHYGVGINNDSFACSARNFGKPCPVCQTRAKFLDSPDTESQDKADGLKPKFRQLFLVFDHDEPDKGIQLWEVALYNFGRHIEEYIEGTPKEERGDIRQYYHPTKGFTIRVTCKETAMGQGKPYTDFLVHSFHPRTKPLPLELFDHGFDLDDMVTHTDYDVFKRVHLGIDDGAEVPDDAGGGDDTGDGGGVEHTSRPAASSRNGDGAKPKPAPEQAPAPPAKWIPCSGDRVSVEFKGEQTEGVIEKVKLEDKVAYVKLEGREKSMGFDWSDLTLVEADTTFDAKPGDGKQPGWDKTDDAADDDGRSFKRGGNKPATKPAVDVGDADPTPPTKKRK